MLPGQGSAIVRGNAHERRRVAGIAEVLQISDEQAIEARQQALIALRRRFRQAGLAVDDWTWPL